MNSQDFRALQEAYFQVVENQQLDEMPYQVYGSPDGKKEKKIGKPVKSRKYADARAAELEDTHKKTGGKYRSQYVEDYDLYDIILSHLLDEGYAETLEAAEAIMVNMSEEWREHIIDEAYVDYRKGKLPSGRTPQTALKSGVERAKVNASREQRAGGSFGTTATPSWKRAKKADAVGREMDAHTGLGGKINKALSPGLGNRPGAGPRVAYGEPNTDRHQGARSRRGQSSTKD